MACPEYQPPAICNPSFVKNPKTQVTPEQAACMPWPPGGPGKPCQCRKFLCGQNIDICPTKKKYLPPARTKQCRPQERLCLPCAPFSKDTIYRGSYYPNCGQKAALQLPKGNLCFSSCPMEKRTIQKLSFPGWYNVDPACPILPCRREWWKGPMQELTTQKHDYVPKPFSKRCLLRKPNCLVSGCGPSSNCTEFRANFKFWNVAKTDKFSPTGNICFSSCPMETNTTQKLSYQPNPVPEREHLPWADRGKYKPPCLKVENNTTYRMSYEPPGDVIDDQCAACACSMGGCCCEYPGQCFGLPDPRPVLYPKASC